MYGVPMVNHMGTLCLMYQSAVTCVGFCCTYPLDPTAVGVTTGTILDMSLIKMLFVLMQKIFVMSLMHRPQLMLNS